jgi:hypothetical protein
MGQNTWANGGISQPATARVATRSGGLKRRTSLNKELDKLVHHGARGKAISRTLTKHRVTLLPASGWTSHLNGLHTGLTSGSNIWYEIRYATRCRVSLGLLHQQPGHGNATAGSQVSGCFVTGLETDHAPRPDHVFSGFGVVVFIIRKLRQLGLKCPNFVLELDDIVTVDLLAFGGVQVLAY